MKRRTRRSLAVIAGVVALVAAAPASADTVYIPKIKVFQPITTSLDTGAIKWYQDQDTVALAGHRTHGPAPFNAVNRLVAGDLIRTGGKNYKVVRTEIVRPWEMWILNWKGLVITACSLPNGMPTSGSWRIVVFAR